MSPCLEGLCILRKDGGPWEQNMGRSLLARYLYEHSSWIEGAFTAGGISDKGTKLDFPVGEYAEVMASETVEKLLSELDSIPSPDPDAMPLVSKQLAHLRGILEAATRDPGQVALLYIS